MFKLFKQKKQSKKNKPCFPVVPFSIKMQMNKPLNKTEKDFISFIEDMINE